VNAESSGDQALRSAVERAQSTGGRNLPDFTDLPIAADTANLREGPELHPNCLALLPLIGVWRGGGEVVYPTIEGPYHFGQQLVICHDGRPFLRYESRTWLVDDAGEVIRPAARETGFWRPQSDDSIELLAAHATGMVEIYYGRPRNQTSWELATDAVVRTSSAKEVTGAHRLYGIVEGGDLAYVEQRAMVGQPMQPHVSALLHRIIG
jgi:hypothetical protein